MEFSNSPRRLLRAASLATLLGALMCVVPIMFAVWLDRNTSYWVGGKIADQMFQWMALAVIAGAFYGGLFGLFIGVVIGIIEMPTPVAVIVGIIAGTFPMLITSAGFVSLNDFWGVLGILATPAGGLIGLCSSWWANRPPGPRLTPAEDEANSGRIFNFDDGGN